MKVNNLDSAMRVALIGTLIIVMLCVISFGLNRNQTIPSQDPGQFDSRHYATVPMQMHMQPVVMVPAAPTAAPAVDPFAASARLASLERSVDALSGDAADREISRRLEQIESHISRRGPDEVDDQLADRIHQMSSSSQSGMRQLNNSMQQVNQSVSGLSGTVVQLDQSVTSLHDQQVILRQAVEQQPHPKSPNGTDSEQIRADVASLVTGINELKTEIAGLKHIQQTAVVAPSQPTPQPVSNVSSSEVRPVLDPPAASTADNPGFLPLAPGSEELPQPEPFPASLPIPAADFVEPQILPQSATFPSVETIESAALETHEADADGSPTLQPATLSPNWPTPAADVPEVAAPAPRISEIPEPDGSIGLIALPAPGPISQMSFLPQVPGVVDSSGSDAMPAGRYEFMATVIHVSTGSQDGTAQPRLVRLEDKGSLLDQANGHEAMVQKLLRNAGRRGTAEIVNSGRMAVTTGESGRMAIGSPCRHCNREHGVEAGDEIVLTLSSGQIHVEAMSPQRGVRVETVPLAQFDPAETVGESTWLLCEAAQEGSVGESTEVGDTRTEFVQRLIVITRSLAGSGSPQQLPVPTVENEPRLLPAIDFTNSGLESSVAGPRESDRGIFPAGYDRTKPAPRLLNPEAMQNAVRAPHRAVRKADSEIEPPVVRPESAGLNPLKVLRSVFNSQKSEATELQNTNRSRTGSAARGRSRR